MSVTYTGITKDYYYLMYFHFLQGKPVNPTLAANPFSTEPVQPPRPVFNTTPPKPTINEIKQQSFAPFTTPAPTVPVATTGFGVGGTTAFGTNGSAFGVVGEPVQDPWTPVQSTNGTNVTASPWTKAAEPTANPFLS